MLYVAALERPQDAAKLAPEKVGFRPYIAIEMMERLQAALREWRTLSTAVQEKLMTQERPSRRRFCTRAG